MMKEIRNIQKQHPQHSKNNTRKHQTSRSTLQHYNMEKSWRNMMKEIRNIRNIQKITPATIEIYFCNITT
jgi:hypothetical protein